MLSTEGWIPILIPGALALIMLGMGMRLHIADFTRVFREPKAVLVGLACQIVVLPIIALGLVLIFPMRPEFSIGLMLIALSPGGVVSNMFSLLARGDLGLSVSLTAISSSACVLTVPFLLSLLLPLFLGVDTQISLPILSTMKQIAYMTIIPVSLGMLINSQAPKFCDWMEQPLKVFSTAFLGIAVVLILLREQERFVELLFSAGPAAVLLNVVAMALGWVIAHWAVLSSQQQRTLVIEVGIQNAILATAIAVSPAMLNNITIAMVPTIYGFTMMVIVAAYLFIVLRKPISVGA
jgi:BASS family bile acid:Na+ symporter